MSERKTEVEKCGDALDVVGAVLYCTGEPGHEGDHSATVKWARSTSGDDSADVPRPDA